MIDERQVGRHKWRSITPRRHGVGQRGRRQAQAWRPTIDRQPCRRLWGTLVCLPDSASTISFHETKTNLMSGFSKLSLTLVSVSYRVYIALIVVLVAKCYDYYSAPLLLSNNVLLPY